MQYRQYGKNGPVVSRLGFGAMRLPRIGWKDDEAVNLAPAVRVIRRALRAGVSFIDTHHNYHGGHSEAAIGKALTGWKGPRPTIQTKTPFYREEPMDWFKQKVDEAVEKLGVECIDYLFFHSMDMKMFKKGGKGFLKLTDWAMKRGIVARRGFSSHDSVENIKKFVDTGEFSAMLVSYNWLNPYVRDAIAYAAEAGMGVSVMNPVGGGSLSATTKQVLGLLPGAASSPEVSLRYVLATPGVVTAMSGMSSPSQVDENVAVAGRKEPMTARQWGVMEKRLGEVKRRFDSLCTSCGYCAPCPHGVYIPDNFRLLNQAKFLGLTRFARQRFKQMREHKDGDRSAFACKQCGRCIPKCPNHVPIIEQLALTADFLG